MTICSVSFLHEKNINPIEIGNAHFSQSNKTRKNSRDHIVSPKMMFLPGYCRLHTSECRLNTLLWDGH